jgi:DNA-binding transcriptional regulator YdaS (Cro superfamily)
VESKNISGIDQATSIVGGQAALARLLGCSQQVVSFWVRRGYAPNMRAIEIEQHTGVQRLYLIDPRLGLTPDPI